MHNVCSRHGRGGGGGGGGGGMICFLCCHIFCDWFRGLVPIKPVQTLLHPVTSKIPSSVPHHRNQRSTGVRCWVSTLRVCYHPQTMQHDTSVLFQCSGINPTGTLPPPNNATPHFSAFPVFRYQPHGYTTTPKPCNTLQCFSGVQVSTPPVHYHPQTVQHHASVLFRCSGINPAGTLSPPNHST